METSQFVALFLGSPAVTALVGFVWREKFKSDLEIDRQKTINTHKHTLETYTESMKHSLQREMIRVEHSVRSKFTIYPKLFARFARASGAIEGLYGFRMVTNYDRITEADICQMLSSRGVLDGEQQEILSAFRINRKEGTSKLKEMLEEIQYQGAQLEFQKSKNYLILNELFISDEVNTAAEELIKELGGAWASALTNRMSKGRDVNFFEDYRRYVAQAKISTANLKAAMKSELDPSI